MPRGFFPIWPMAAALFGGLCLLQAWDSRQIDRMNLAPAYAVRAGTPAIYRAITRAEIMLAEAGQFLN
ncbi:MAG: hypothetical protein NTY77_08005 [Elusimicrobia bacterium]|nr:hypothetical protein [Elusimicrobiota bacterium]